MGCHFVRNNNMMNLKRPMEVADFSSVSSVRGRLFRGRNWLVEGRNHSSASFVRSHLRGNNISCIMKQSYWVRNLSSITFVKSFIRKQYVRHEMTHTGRNLLSVTFCERSFIKKVQLKRTHTNKKPSQYQYCERSFIQKQQCNTVHHEMTLTG